jgi:hypothetical protein
LDATPWLLEMFSVQREQWLDLNKAEPGWTTPRPERSRVHSCAVLTAKSPEPFFALIYIWLAIILASQHSLGSAGSNGTVHCNIPLNLSNRTAANPVGFPVCCRLWSNSFANQSLDCHGRGCPGHFPRWLEPPWFRSFSVDVGQEGSAGDSGESKTVSFSRFPSMAIVLI